jgi:hypothetical protein
MSLHPGCRSIFRRPSERIVEDAVDKPAVMLLDASSAPMRSIGTRLRRLGYPVLPAKTPDQGERLLRTRHGLTAALIPVALPTFDLRAALRFLRKHEVTGELTFVAVGRKPDHDALALLREAGVELALWEPMDDHLLRFQVNRALASSKIVLGGRACLRAPADWETAIRTGARRKPARIYSLSAQGAYLATGRPSLPGATIGIDLPVSSGTARLEANVVMTNVPGHFLRPNLPLGMGIRFQNLSTQVEDALTVWARKRLNAIGF